MAAELDSNAENSWLTLKNLWLTLTASGYRRRADQAAVRDAINRLQRVRDDLLKAMFPKGAK